MILIISKNDEITTDEVIKWLLAMGKKFIRVNEDEVFEIKVNQKRVYIESHRNSFFLDEIASVWYRRGGLKFKQLSYKNPAIQMHMRETQHWLEEYVLKTLEAKKHINKQSNSHVNKLVVLEKAIQVGLDVPDYYLADSTADVVLNETIVKPITGTPILNALDGKANAMMYTTVVEEPEEQDFFISFFQEKVEKDFEIRSFYLNGKTSSIAIISQNDEQTKTDYRKYNIQKPNRNVRYNLPKEVEDKINLLMLSLDLNCGSLDFIKSGDRFYFLEVNTIGQFLGLAEACNFSFDKEIADYL